MYLERRFRKRTLGISPQCIVSLVVFGISLLASTARAQTVSPQPSRQATTPVLPEMTKQGTEDPQAQVMEEQRRKLFTDERHKRIVADTDKLLQLATELKNEVTTTTKNELSIAVIKKAADIEKLAHEVRERMKQ